MYNAKIIIWVTITTNSYCLECSSGSFMIYACVAHFCFIEHSFGKILYCQWLNPRPGITFRHELLNFKCKTGTSLLIGIHLESSNEVYNIVFRMTFCEITKLKYLCNLYKLRTDVNPLPQIRFQKHSNIPAWTCIDALIY